MIITYYWPPSGGSGVQRWLKFVKYLPEFGYHPFVFSPENPAFAIRDPSLEKDVPAEADVIRFPIWEPYDIFFRLGRIFGLRQSAKPNELVSARNAGFFKRVSTWIRANLIIPDPRIFWVNPSVSFLEDFIHDNGITTVVTTGPPHSLHLIGLKLKTKKPSIKWVADFRDPWSEWGLLQSLRVGTRAMKKHRALEARVLGTADEVITITPFYARQFGGLGNRHVHLFTNGYDEDDFSRIRYSRSEKFLIRHVGIVNEKCNPRPFLQAMKALMAERADVARDVLIEFIGEINADFKKFVMADNDLKKIVVFSGSKPHDELIEVYGSSSLLLLILTGYKDAEGYMPGKLFEYIATGLPVLGVGPVDGDAAALLNETSSGEMVDSDDKEGLKKALLGSYQRWSVSAAPSPPSAATLKYSRRQITRALAELLG